MLGPKRDWTVGYFKGGFDWKNQKRAKNDVFFYFFSPLFIVSLIFFFFYNLWRGKTSPKK